MDKNRLFPTCLIIWGYEFVFAHGMGNGATAQPDRAGFMSRHPPHIAARFKGTS